MNDFITTCKLFAMEHFGEDIETPIKESVGISERVTVVESVKADLNKGGIHKYDSYLDNLKTIYESLEPSDLSQSLLLDVDQNFKTFIQGVDESI